MPMKLMISVALVITSASLTVGQGPTKHPIKEVKAKTVAGAAPSQCLLAFSDFLAYLQKSETNIVKDERSQKLFLTSNMRKTLMDHAAKVTEGPDVPDNGDFIGSWDYPTTYSIVGSRRYGKRAIIDVLYKWGPNTNYEGDERLSSFVYLLEEGRWKLDDIYTFRGEFVTAESLNQLFLGIR
jgi:hypothetical protein